MGAVVSAMHVALGERVALKFLNPALAATDTDAIGRFVREAKATSRIKSEHVVRVTDVGATDDGMAYIAMELLEGEDLATLLSRGVLPLALAVDCTLQGAEALSEAHAVGVVHRDIKPSNLWMARRSDGSPLVKVLDFGISKLAKADEAHGNITSTQSVFGSPTYMSPEQIRSAKRVDHRTDVWALGVVLFELLTGRLPFESETVAGVLAAISADAPTPLRALRPEMPEAVERAILRCLEKDPARRASLPELAELLVPFATPNGRIAGERIPRIGSSPSMPVGIPPTTLPPAPPVTSSQTLAMSATEPNMTTANLDHAGGASGALRLRRAAMLVVVGIVGVGLVAVAFVTMSRRAHLAAVASAKADSASVPAVATSSATASVAAAPPPIEPTSPAPIASAAASAATRRDPPDAPQPKPVAGGHAPRKAPPPAKSATAASPPPIVEPKPSPTPTPATAPAPTSESRH